jgi:5-methylcytosine-specific restriction endonuclease McrA
VKARPLYRINKAMARRAVRVRDGDLCWICGEEVIEGLRQGHRRQATLDHIYERSRGGSDELHNLALAHAGCNAERSKTAFQRLLDMIERMVEGSNEP